MYHWKKLLTWWRRWIRWAWVQCLRWERWVRTRAWPAPWLPCGGCSPWRSPWRSSPGPSPSPPSGRFPPRPVRCPCPLRRPGRCCHRPRCSGPSAIRRRTWCRQKTVFVSNRIRIESVKSPFYPIELLSNGENVLFSFFNQFCKEVTFHQQLSQIPKCLHLSVQSVLGPLAALAAPMQMELIENVRVVEGTAGYPGAVWFIDVDLDWKGENWSYLEVGFNQVCEKQALRVCPPALKRLPVWTCLYPKEKVKLEKLSSTKLAEFACVVLMSIGDCLEPPQSV